MMMTAPSVPAELDLTLRVGCSLVYEVTGTASLLLNLRPRPDGKHAVLAEGLALGLNQPLPSEEFWDTHGNRVCRVTLRSGSNLIRHDAIVAVSAQPDNDGFTGHAELSPDRLPSSVLRYTFPSRYCDSDKLANFAWEKFGKIEHGLPRVQAISRW